MPLPLLRFFTQYHKQEGLPMNIISTQMNLVFPFTSVNYANLLREKSLISSSTCGPNTCDSSTVAVVVVLSLMTLTCMLSIWTVHSQPLFLGEFEPRDTPAENQSKIFLQTFETTDADEAQDLKTFMQNRRPHKRAVMPCATEGSDLCATTANKLP